MLAQEAEIIYACARFGLPLPVLDGMELWEAAASLGLHRIETLADHDAREITESKKEYWEQTREARSEKLEGYSERRRQRALERRQAKREGKSNV